MTDQMRVERSPGWRVHVPAGTYFLGDPCYAVPDDDWAPLLEAADYFLNFPTGNAPGKPTVLAFSTAYGDGIYRDNEGHEYPVDAGMIGLVPADYAKAHHGMTLEELGQVVTFDQPVVATSNGFGRLAFGRYEINTQDESDDALEDSGRR